MKLLLDTRKEKYYVGNSYEDLLRAYGMVSFNVPNRTAYATGRKFQYSDEYTEQEFVREASRDVVQHLCNNCWFQLFNKVQ